MIKTTKTILVTAGMVLCMGIATFAATSETQQEAIIAESISPEDVGVRTAQKYINLHNAPSNEAEIIAVIPRGDQVVVTDRIDGFLKVSWKDLEGYIGDSMLVSEQGYQEFLNNIPYHEEIPLDQDLQKYLWLECYDTGVDYAFALAIIDRETGGTFNPNAISKTHDYGLFQCNRCWRSTFKKLGIIQESMEELLNPYNSIHAGLYLLSQYVAQYGPSQAAAFKYNTGHGGANSSNAYSRDVMNNRYPKWKAIVEQ